MFNAKKGFGVLAAGAWLAVIVSGCGYTTHAYVAMTGYRTIYVAPFVNKVDTTSEYSEGRRFKSYYPLLENTVTNIVIDRYKLDGNLKIVKEERADLILRGELINYRKESLRDSSADTPEEYRITLFVNIALVDAKTQKSVWEYKDFAGDTSYYTTGSFTKTEAQALEDAAKDLARRVVETTVEAW